MIFTHLLEIQGFKPRVLHGWCDNGKMQPVETWFTGSNIAVFLSEKTKLH
jgi:hypothetical protein